MAIKKTLIEIVKQLLSDMDSEDVNSISDTVESQQVASIVEQVFYDMVAARRIPEHEGLIKLTASADSAYPTHFTFPDNVKHITHVWYDKSDDGSLEYDAVYWMEPMQFLEMCDAHSSDYDTVLDKQAGTSLRITNNKHPSYYTSFDDENIVMDSYKSTVESTLQQSKVRAYGVTIPVFSQTDSYTPDIDNVLFPLLIAEARTMCFELLGGGTTQVIDRAARRQRAWVQNDKHKLPSRGHWNDFGRK
jgi:hypothetical protein